jgi:hypothetical protein
MRRESPLHAAHLESLLKLARLGANAAEPRSGRVLSPLALLRAEPKGMPTCHRCAIVVAVPPSEFEPPMSRVLIDDLRKQIAGRQAIAIVGAGVSMGATGNAPAASWLGLLRLGIERCVDLSRADDAWAKRQQEALAGDSLQDTLEVAEAVSGRLGFPHDREWIQWLQDTVGQLASTELAVLEALGGLGIRIATTNYDGLIASALGLPAVTWKEPDRVVAVLRGERQGIIHLHGFGTSRHPWSSASAPMSRCWDRPSLKRCSRAWVSSERCSSSAAARG